MLVSGRVLKHKTPPLKIGQTPNMEISFEPTEYVSYPHQGAYINVTEANINHKQVNINNSNDIGTHVVDFQICTVVN